MDLEVPDNHVDSNCRIHTPSENILVGDCFEMLSPNLNLSEKLVLRLACPDSRACISALHGRQSFWEEAVLVRRHRLMQRGVLSHWHWYKKQIEHALEQCRLLRLQQTMSFFRRQTRASEWLRRARCGFQSFVKCTEQNRLARQCLRQLRKRISCQIALSRLPASSLQRKCFHAFSLASLLRLSFEQIKEATSLKATSEPQSADSFAASDGAKQDCPS
eukprot:TRINITY_DN102727_c0_g1_i1.p1 TRINITY_DN102727_c0_g1~~TRINITY_DN102727_c0_g1_i1.p1  ORF type:complete len:218 (-),score=25.63 TRINITY_DN102727_c0_g1_i1:452-1105(-)